MQCLLGTCVLLLGTCLLLLLGSCSISDFFFRFLIVTRSIVKIAQVGSFKFLLVKRVALIVRRVFLTLVLGWFAKNVPLVVTTNWTTKCLVAFVKVGRILNPQHQFIVNHAQVANGLTTTAPLCQITSMSMLVNHATRVSSLPTREEPMASTLPSQPQVIQQHPNQSK